MYVFKTVYLVAGIYTLGRIADLKVHAAFKSREFLQNRNANVLGAARINGRFVHNYRALRQISAEDLARTDDRRQIGRVVGVDRRRNGNDMEFCLLQHRFVGGELHRRVLYRLVADLFRGVDARFIKVYFRFVKVKTDDVYPLLRERNRDRHTDVAETDQRKIFFFLYEFFEK